MNEQCYTHGQIFTEFYGMLSWDKLIERKKGEGPTPPENHGGEIISVERPVNPP